MKTVSEQLKELGQGGILTTAVDEGIITELKCSMDECFCPRGSGYFERRPEPVSDWAPSVDHVTLKSEGGQLTLDNIRLAHVLCNRVDYAIKQDKPHDKDLKRAMSGHFRKDEAENEWLSVQTRVQELAQDAKTHSLVETDESESAFLRGRAEALQEVALLLRRPEG
jgi:HNH endonuclease